MKYITKEDLQAVIQEEMLMASIEKQEELLYTIEASVIDEVQAYIGGRYDVAKIFGNPVIANGIINRIIAVITAYRAVRRNAARKSSGYEELNEWAYGVLQRISDGKMPLPGLPGLVDPDTGKPASGWGTNRRDEYFF